MAQTQVRGSQILNASIQRQDLDTTTVGQAVATKLIQGTNITLSSTGADSGTGDVTINCPTGGTGPAGPQGVRGSQWFNGTGAPPTPVPGSLPGDYYLDNSSGDVWAIT